MNLQTAGKEMKAQIIQSFGAMRPPQVIWCMESTLVSTNAGLEQKILMSPSAIRASVLSLSALWSAPGDKHFKEREYKRVENILSAQSKPEKETAVYTERK